MENPSPTLSSVTFAPVWMRVGVRPARESCAVSAIVKHPAWAAPINSSGLVAAWPSSNRDLNEYGPSKAPLPTLSRPLPSARLPFHSASAFRVGMEPPFTLPSFSVSLFENCSAAVSRNFNARLGTKRRRCRPRAYLAEPGPPGRGIAAGPRPAFETALTTPKGTDRRLLGTRAEQSAAPGPLRAPTYRPGDGADDARGTVGRFAG